MSKVVYLDNAATTPVKKEVLEVMLPYFTEFYGNPSSTYGFASKCKMAIKNTREIIANSLNTSYQNIFFTSGGTESDNWALKVCAENYSKNGKHIITSKIEHHAVLNTCKYLEKNGFDITYINVDENGCIDLNELEKVIRDDTILISIMFANNEIGTIEPIKEIGEIAKKHNILFHTDAVQAYGHVKIDVEELNIDLLSASGHKFNAPKGIGFLYVRENLKLKSFIHGGNQENKYRAGTENVASIVGLGKAVELAFSNIEEREKKEKIFKDKIIKEVLEKIPYTKINGDIENGLSNIVNFSFEFIDGDMLVMLLDMKGICVSSGSACAIGSNLPSHTLMSIGLKEEIARGSIRISLSDLNTFEEIEYTIECFVECVEKIRNMSSVYQSFVKKNRI